MPLTTPAAPRLPIATARATAEAGHDADLTMLLDWIESYLMRGNADLGRGGAVCPYTLQASKLNTARVAISRAGPADEAVASALVGTCVGELDQIPCRAGAEHFRTTIVGFPGCASPEGVAMLGRVAGEHGAAVRGRGLMVGLFDADSDAPGLWNERFRPMRSPIPVLAIRHMVDQDAPFASRHPRLAVTYLRRFGLPGLKRILVYRRRTR